uniref:Uncharacterized protein n=1 Tax=Gasterosteus aculeatus TaxID=69293 RepID=G3PQ41_GASAC
MRAAGHRLAAALALFAAALCACRAEVIDDVLSSLSRGASFLERQHAHINLDGVVGFLMLQAELKEAVRTWPHSDPVSWAQRTTAVALVKRLDQSFDKAVAALQRNDPKYYREFEPLLSWSFWLVPREWSSTDRSLLYRSHHEHRVLRRAAQRQVSDPAAGDLEDERDALHRHQTLPGHHDPLRLPPLLPVPPAALLHDREDERLHQPAEGRHPALPSQHD